MPKEQNKECCDKCNKIEYTKNSNSQWQEYCVNKDCPCHTSPNPMTMTG